MVHLQAKATRVALASSVRSGRSPWARGAVQSQRGQHTLPKLAYAYNALEPHISKDIMELHHSKHHQTYVNGLNAAEEQIQSAFKSGDTKKQISLQAAIKFNGGGHINHSLFWTNLAPEAEGGGKLEEGSLKDAIDKDFGGLEKFQKQFSAAAASIQGSGWAWLGYNQGTGKLEIVTTKDQDPLLSHIPIIGLDMWEHAFYLQYKNVKPSYITAAFNVINWKEGQERLEKAMA